MRAILWATMLTLATTTAGAEQVGTPCQCISYELLPTMTPQEMEAARRVLAKFSTRGARSFRPAFGDISFADRQAGHPGDGILDGALVVKNLESDPADQPGAGAGFAAQPLARRAERPDAAAKRSRPSLRPSYPCRCRSRQSSTHRPRRSRQRPRRRPSPDW
jgi:hypothetical protein